MSGSKAGAARARSGKGRGNAGATPAPAARQGAASARDAASQAADAASQAREAAADAGPREGEYVVTLPSFEGPLDLLLHLIQQHELDILDIPVSFVTEKYLEYLKVMGSLSIDLSSEYLVMAATLVHIKSKMLLPSVPAGQDDDGMPGEEEDPRAELVRRLLEYQKYKVAASELSERGTLGRDVFTRGMSESEVPQGPAPFTSTPIFSLLDAFERVLKRTNVQIDHEVVFDRISITDRMVELTEKLSARRSMRFEDLLLDSVSKGGVIPRFELVITFLAVLEMCKLRLIRVHQTDPLAPIHIQLSAADGAPAVDFEIEDGAPAVERIEAAGGEEAGAPPAAGEGGVAEPAEVEGGEPAWPEGVEPIEPRSGEPAGTEPAEAVEAPSGEPGWPEVAEPAEESSGEPAGAELAGPAEEASRAHDIAGGEPATEAEASPALEAEASPALEAEASPALEQTERDALADPSDLPASEDTAAPPTEVDEVDAGSGRDGG
ncbi:segregation/condensation protein A [Sorangium sp. So ce1014]|uniref:segregation and condensation protein A n=1 Tax=Sorangium sp. So ce1014 TaxID=3133326 RepID=UPI003F5E64B6